MPNARSAKSTREKAAALRAEAEAKAARRRALMAGLAVILVIAVAVTATVLIRTLKKQQDDKVAAQTAPPANLYTPPAGTPGGTAAGVLIGKESAKVTVNVYEDFMCPVCKEFEAADGPVLKEYADAGKIKMIYHPVAILDDRSSTAYSSRAAGALAAALNVAPQTFAPLHTALFDNQPAEGGAGLPDSTLLDLAVKAGVPKAQVESAIMDHKYQPWAKKITEAFTKAYPPGGTPTLIIQGDQLKSLAPADLKSALDKAVTSAG